MELEICCSDIGSINAAAEAGVKRIELCADLAEGGITPPAGYFMHASALRPTFESFNVLIRPRGGHFIYSPSEVRAMAADIEYAAAARATGVVIGALTGDATLDTGVMETLIKAARDNGLEVILSRAIDVSRDPLDTLREAIDLGMDRVLTSGGAPDVARGLDRLARMQSIAAGSNTVIMAGGGITPGLISPLAAIGIRAVHSTASWGNRISNANPEMPSGFGSYRGPRTLTSAIQDLQHAINSL